MFAKKERRGNIRKRTDREDDDDDNSGKSAVVQVNPAGISRVARFAASCNGSLAGTVMMVLGPRGSARRRANRTRAGPDTGVKTRV
jgi:hypothetical protein